MTSWFYVSPAALQSSPVYLDQENLNHLTALRLKKGDTLVLSDGQGHAVYGCLETLQPDSARISLLEDVAVSSEPPIRIHLYMGITKGDKLDAVVRQCVELGARRVIPVLTERTVVARSADGWEKKALRWRNIARAAAAQSRRSMIPDVSSPLHFQEMLLLLKNEELVLVPWEEEKTAALGPILKRSERPPGSLAIFTGPEGGISPAEMEKLVEIPTIRPVTLGPRILRAETAPVAALAVIMGYWGDMV